MDILDFIRNEGIPKWPYPIEYGEETEDSSDVVIIGGGLAGCCAAIHAARRGASVTVIEKGSTKRSGSAGPGIDHWEFAVTNPCSSTTPDEMVEIMGKGDIFEAEHLLYVALNESFDTLLEFEEMGLKIRDTDDDFKDAPFRDEKSKLLFAYDYDGKLCLRIFGAGLKPALYKEMKRLGVKIYDRVMGTSLLTEKGEQGRRVIGATGYNVRTGRFYIFNAKATVIATAKPVRLWEFGSEKVGSASCFQDVNCTGEGHAMAWKAGAKFVLMERNIPYMGSMSYPPFSTGNSRTTWFPCNMVDAHGKPLPWGGRYGQPLEGGVHARTHCGEGQKFLYQRVQDPAYALYGYMPDLPERIRNGEFRLPFYADLPSMPDEERDVIFGMMVGNESKTRTPVFRKLTQAGFNPDKDMLQANIDSPEGSGINTPIAPPSNSPNIRDASFLCGGPMIGWEMKTNLEGLFIAGNQTGTGCAAIAATTGRYCGRSVAKYVKDKDFINPYRPQIDEEKERIYAPLKNDGGKGWKEVQIGLCRVMQDYCGQYKSEEILKTGLWWLNSIRENEIKNLSVNNPHELARVLECDTRVTVGEIIMHNSLARKTSCPQLDFKRLDNSEVKAAEEESFITVQQADGKIMSEEVPLGYWLMGDFEPTLAENYKKYSCFEDSNNGLGGNSK